MKHPVTLTLLFVAAVLAVANAVTTHSPTINGAGFLAILLLLVAIPVGYGEHHRTPADGRTTREETHHEDQD